MKLRYTGGFLDVNGVVYTINIYKKGYTGSPEELLLSGDPLHIDYLLADVFKPIKYSGCSINVLTPKILIDLYTPNPLDVKIDIIKDSELFWSGYNSPNVYSLDFSIDCDEITIEAIDKLSVLQYFDYEYIDREQIQTFLSVIKHILGDDVNLSYRSLFDDLNLLTNLKCIERTFFDEDEVPLKLNEVLEHIMQFLGCTMMQWKDTIYITDVESTYKDNPKTYEVAENNSTVSYGDIYNLINVISNLLEVEEEVLDVFSDDGVERISDGYKIVIGDTKKNTAKYMLYAYYDKPNITYNKPTFNGTSYYTDSLLTGLGLFIREASDKIDYIESYSSLLKCYTLDPSTQLDFTNYFVFKTGRFIPDGTSVLEYDNDNKVLSIESPESVFYGRGDVLILSMKFRPAFSPMYDNNFFELTEKDTISSVIDIPYIKGTSKAPLFLITGDKARLRGYYKFLFLLLIGLYYWNGIKWTTTESYFTAESEMRGALKGKINDVDYPLPYIDTGWDGDWSLKNENSYKFALSADTAGILIPVEMRPYLSGKIKLSVYDCLEAPFSHAQTSGWIGGTTTLTTHPYMLISNLKITHAVTKAQTNIYDAVDEDKDEDIKYSAVIDDANVSEYDDITLYLNTYNPIQCRKMSYSYVLGEDDSFLQTLSKNGVVARPEEHIVEMYVKHYGEPKINHSNTLKNNGITPYDVVYVDSLDKYLSVGSIEYDLRLDTVEVNLFEL